jgi:hypothetical protein
MNKKGRNENCCSADTQREGEKLSRYSWLLENTRAGKLLLKNKPFIVVAIDEPYYPEVYKLIRKNEKGKGRWTVEDEREFQQAIQAWIEL